MSDEHLIIDITINIPYMWSAGKYYGKFFKELRDNAKFFANVCPRCKRVLFPPRVVCGRCHVRAKDEWIELGPEGEVLDYTFVYYKMMDPSTGKPRPEPYPHAVIALDGGGLLQHYLGEVDKEDIKVGMRVEPVFKKREERIGHFSDILYFRPKRR